MDCGSLLPLLGGSLLPSNVPAACHTVPLTRGRELLKKRKLIDLCASRLA